MDTKELQERLPDLFPDFAAAMKVDWPMMTFTDDFSTRLKLFLKWVNQ